MTTQKAEYMVTDEHELKTLITFVKEQKLAEELIHYGDLNAVTIIQLVSLIRQAAEHYNL